jgi:hypothetical protein
MSQRATKASEARQGWLYLGKLGLLAFTVLCCLVALKHFTEHRLAPRNFGIGGALYQPRLDLLLLGSSHTRKAYDMRLLEKDTGVMASFQIAYDGTDLTVISQMLDYLAARPEHCPRFLVVEAYGAFLARKPDLQDPRYYSDAPPALKTAILRTYFSGRSYRSAFADVFDLVVNRGNEEIVTHPFYSPIVEKGSYKGGRTDFYFRGLSPEEFRALKATTNGNLPDPAQLSALYHIIEVTRSHGIAAMFIDPPLPQPISSIPDIQILKRRYREILAGRGVPYVDGDVGFPIDDPSLFSDNNHLSSKGREEFTSRIAVELRAWMMEPQRLSALPGRHGAANP